MAHLEKSGSFRGGRGQRVLTSAKKHLCEAGGLMAYNYISESPSE